MATAVTDKQLNFQPWQNISGATIQQLWTNVNTAVDQEVDRDRMVAKAFPIRLVPNASSVPDDSVDDRTGNITEGQTKTVVEFAVALQPMSVTQVASEAVLGNVATSAQREARTLLQFENALLLQGKTVQPPPAQGSGPHQVNIPQVQAFDDGLVNRAQEVIQVPRLTQLVGGKAELVQGILWGDNTFDKVVEGIAKLTKKLHSGPYVLLLDPEVYADTFTQADDRQSMTADRIRPLVTAGFLQTTGLPTKAEDKPNHLPERQTGLLVSMGGDPVVIYSSQAPVTEPTSQDASGNFNFRVVERLALIVREDQAIARLDFQLTLPP